MGQTPRDATSRSRAAGLFMALALVAGCSQLPAAASGIADANGELPAAASGMADANGERQPCRDVFSEARCDVIVLTAALKLEMPPEQVAEVAIIPEPVVYDANGNRVLKNRSGGPPLNVRVTLAGGTTCDLFLGCIGLAMQPVCTDEPFLRAEGFIGSGYRDTPGGATPVPARAPGALAKAVPLRVDRLDIPIDRVGDYRISLGEAVLPNGWLDEASFELVDDWPEDVTILSGRVSMEIDSLEPDGKPFDNVYAHGWRKGTERVKPYVVFHVDAFEPGAILSIKDVIVE